jgi:tyrosyl-tRNA synthetase
MEWRGLVKQVSHERLSELMASEKLTLYSGFDPTAPSLHLGHLMPILGLRRAQLLGHRPVVLVGGATGMIGDPSGKSAERNLLSRDDIERNSAALKAQLGRFLDFSDALLVNNADWFSKLSFLDVLRDIGKHFSVNAMIAKDSVRARLEERESGISYTEFSYQLIQAYDFYWLHQHHGCRLQIGGSEQWGNITAGIDLIRRLAGKEAYALTLPLILDASGKKFGKTEAGAVWLDADLTKPYDFYQYLIRTDDRDVGRTLRFLTMLDRATIEALEAEHARAPEKREAQRVLARELTTMVHGAEATREAEAATAALFGKERGAGQAPPGTPSHALPASALAAGVPIVEALVQSGLCKSKNEARREIEGGGIYVAEERVSGFDRALTAQDLREGTIVLRRGKKNYLVLRFE